MNYLSMPFQQEKLERLSVGSASTYDGSEYVSLRAHVRKGVENGDIKTPLTGVQIAGLNKAACIALLMGKEVPPSEEIQSTNGHGSAAAEVPASMPTIVAAPAGAQDAVASALAVLTGAFGGKVSAEDIRKQVEEKLAPHLQTVQALADSMKEFMAKNQAANDQLRADVLAGRPVVIEIKNSEGETRKVGRQHFLFPLLLKIMEARCHAYLAGPAGSFKTSTAHAAASALELPFYATSVCQQTTKTDLLGFFVPGTGQYMPTDFRRAFEGGGVFLLDEIDAGNANVLAVLNAALANSSMGFPDGMVERHKDFILVAAGNTYGQGANRQYVGRNQLDAATLDRFAFVDFPYDTGLEAEYCGVEGRPSPVCNLMDGGSITADGWLSRVAKVRESAEKQSIRAVFSTRASIMGVKLAARGIGKTWLENMLLWKGIDAATKEKLNAKA